MIQPPTEPDHDRIYPDNPDSSHEPGPLGVRSFGITDRGLVRASNEDQFLIAVLTKALGIQQSSLLQAPSKYADERGHIFLVADGVGGSPAGKEASTLAVQSIEDFLVNTLKWFFQFKGSENDDVVAEFQDALLRAEAKIFAEVALHPELEGMGTTLTLAYSLGDNLFVAHAGDSRCYLYRDGVLVQLTCDHTLAQDILRQGLVPLSKGDHRHYGHMITNAVGGSTLGVWAEVHKTTLQSGDVLLLATDGLTNAVPDERISATLLANRDPKIACESLMAQSLEQGGRDNITVIVAHYETLAS